VQLSPHASAVIQPLPLDFFPVIRDQTKFGAAIPAIKLKCDLAVTDFR
jgi:hypothetical protein